MYLYKVGYYSWEESQYYEYSHETNYTKEEFFQICRECAVVVARKFIANCKDPKQNHFMPESGFRFTDILGIDWLNEMVNRGFKPVNYNATYAMDGWATLCDDCKIITGIPIEDEESIKLTKFMPEDIKQEAINIGQKCAKKRVKELKELFKKKTGAKRANKRSGKNNKTTKNE